MAVSDDSARELAEALGVAELNDVQRDVLERTSALVEMNPEVAFAVLALGVRNLRCHCDDCDEPCSETTQDAGAAVPRTELDEDIDLDDEGDAAL